MQLEQQESFEIKGPQLEVFGEAETRLPAAAKKRPAALAVLGYGPAEINMALKGLDLAALSLEDIVRQALKKMLK